MDDPRVRAHGDLIASAVEFLKLGQGSVGGPGKIIALALASRIMQIAAAVQQLLVTGHGSEAHPLSRAMLNALATLAAIVESDSDGRAVAFVQHHRRLQERLLERGVAYGAITPTQAAITTARNTETASEQARALAEMRIVARKLGNNDRTWHGLTDAELFRRVGMQPYYELLYPSLSEELHVGVGALETEFAAVVGGSVHIGPRWEVPEEILTVSAAVIPEALSQVSALFGWDRRDAVRALREQSRAMIGSTS